MEKKYTIAPCTYRHYKVNLYEVLYTAFHSETLEEMVVYRPLYGEGGLWVRPKEMFLEKVRDDEDDVEYRFTLIEE